MGLALSTYEKRERAFCCGDMKLQSGLKVKRIVEEQVAGVRLRMRSQVTGELSAFSYQVTGNSHAAAIRDGSTKVSPAICHLFGFLSLRRRSKLRLYRSLVIPANT